MERRLVERRVTPWLAVGRSEVGARKDERARPRGVVRVARHVVQLRVQCVARGQVALEQVRAEPQVQLIHEVHSPPRRVTVRVFK